MRSGFERLSSQPTRLDARRLRAAGLDPALTLSAMVLDVKRTWDALVDRFVKTPAGRRRIRENSFYRNLTRQFAGAEAYAALEQLYDLHNAQRFDIEVVDTPPAAHAFEFIQAPAHLVQLLDSRAARWLFFPYASANRGTLGLAGRAARFVVDRLKDFAGVPMLSAVSEFFVAFGDAAGAISDRFRKTEALLRSPNVNFVLVTTPAEDRLREARDLLERIDGAGLRLGAIVVNRTLDERTFGAFTSAPRRQPVHLEEIAKLRGALTRDGPPDGRLDAIIGYLEEYGANQRGEIERAARFARNLPARVKLAIVPEVEVGVRDLRDLAKIASLLTDVRAGRKFLENAAAVFASPPRRRNPPRACRGLKTRRTC